MLILCLTNKLMMGTIISWILSILRWLLVRSWFYLHIYEMWMNLIPRMLIKLLFPHVPMLLTLTLVVASSFSWLPSQGIMNIYTTIPFTTNIHGKVGMRIVLNYLSQSFSKYSCGKNIRKGLLNDDVKLQILLMRISCFSFIVPLGVTKFNINLFTWFILLYF